MKFGELKKVVEAVLRTEEATRNSDDYLYAAVCEKLNPDCFGAPFYIVLTNRKRYELPSYESVGRVRRKLQNEYPELRAIDKVTYFREALEDDYRRFARS